MSLFTEIHLIANARVTISPYGRLHVGKKYVTVSFHPYCGPEFFYGDVTFIPSSPQEEDELWEEFGKWHARYTKHEEKLRAKGESNYKTIRYRQVN